MPDRIDFTKDAEDTRDEAAMALSRADELLTSSDGGFVKADYEKAQVLATIGVGHAILSLANRVAAADERHVDSAKDLSDEIEKFRVATEERPLT